MAKTEELAELTRCCEGIIDTVRGKLNEEDNAEFKRYMSDLIDVLEQKWAEK